MTVKKPVIKTNLTNVNYSKMYGKTNKYIVIHYTGSSGSALNNTKYFKRSNRGASANYFVDDKDIYMCVKPSDKAWHCGDRSYRGTKHPFYGICTNANSIGIEMCCEKVNGKLHISDKTIANVRLLVLWLMQEYKIPVSHVIRHHDVSGKSCPNANGLLNDVTWKAFRKRITTAPSINVTVKKYFNSTGKYKIIKTPRAIRKGPSSDYPVVGYINEKNVYTITKVSGKYGQLKSGAGWICLRNDYVKKV